MARLGSKKRGPAARYIMTAEHKAAIQAGKANSKGKPRKKWTSRKESMMEWKEKEQPRLLRHYNKVSAGWEKDGTQSGQNPTLPPRVPSTKPLTAEELIVEAYADYCDHIAHGYPKEAWGFYRDDVSVSKVTMERYIKLHPELCPIVLLENAQASNYKVWFSVVADSARGDNLKANTTSLGMIMRNIHDWDKKVEKEDRTDEVLSRFDAYLESAKNKE